MKHTRLGAGFTAALLTTALAGCGSGAAAEDSKALTFVMWGGSIQEANMESYVQPWAEKEGVRVLQDSPTDYAKLRAQVESGKPSWGVVQVEPNFAVQACKEGLLEKIDTSVVDTSVVDPEMVSECAVPNIIEDFTIGYNTDVFTGDHPTDWAEFFDTKEFPGKRGFWKYVTGGIFEAALLADGVAPADLYPLDIDRAFAKLDTIKDDLLFYDTGDQQVQLLASGEAPLVQAWNGRLTVAAAEGQPVANEWGAHLHAYEQFVIPKGYANADLAQEFLGHFVKDVEGQAVWAERTGFSPVNPGALEHVSAETARGISISPEIVSKSAATVDYTYWEEHYDEVTERFNEWLAS